MAFCSNCGAQIEEGAICSCQQQQPNQYAQQPVNQFAQQPNQYAQQPPNQYGQQPPNQYGQQPNQYAPSPNQYVQQPMNQYPQQPPNQYGQPPVNSYGQQPNQYAQPVNQYGQPLHYTQIQNGKTMIRVAGILMTIFGLVAFIIAIAALEYASWLGGSYAALIYLELIGTGMILAFGITGIAVAANKERAGMILTFGIIILIYKVIDIVMAIVILESYYVSIESSVIFSAIFGFILPILYIVGANTRKKSQY